MKSRSLPLLISLALAYGCASQPHVVAEDPEPHPEINCKPYPKPTVITLPDDLTPESLADGWKLSHEEYLAVYRENKLSIAYMEQTRAIGRYFSRCINQFNEMIRRMNKQPAKPEDAEPDSWWNPFD